MFGRLVQHRFLVAIAVLASSGTGNSKNLCDNTPDEQAMLQGLKPVSKTILTCLDEVLLRYRVRGEFAIAVLESVCAAHKDYFGKYLVKKATKEGRNESIDCLIGYVEPRIRCYFRRFDLSMEYEKRATAVLNWYFETVRPLKRHPATWPHSFRTRSSDYTTLMWLANGLR